MNRLRSGLSLSRKLPLLIGGLVTFSLGATFFAVRHEMRDSAGEAAAERLERVAVQLAELARPSLESRQRSLAESANNAVLGEFLEGVADSIAAIAVLSAVQPSSDTGLPVRLRHADGSIALAFPRGDAVAPSVIVPPAGRPALHGPMEAYDGRAAYRIVAAVHRDGAVVGYLEQVRVVRNVSGDAIEELIGSEIQVYFGGRTGDIWSTITGDVVAGMVPLVAGDGLYRTADATAEPALAHARAIGETGLFAITAIPLHAAGARTDAVLRRLLLLGAILLAVGAFAAWLVSRSVNAPLGRLAAAADAIAAGDYARRVALERDDEIGRLAASFDAMASKVEQSHGELGSRFALAHHMAAELEDANQRLQRAIRDAEQARAEAQDANRAKSDFLATMSHEIRTPINAMIGYTELLDMELAGPMTEKQRHYVERVRFSGDHLLTVVNDVLDFAKIESGQLRVERTPFAAQACIATAIAMLQGRAQSRHVELAVACETRLQFLGDARRVEQILLNLLSNALKFTESGGRIEVSCDLRRSRALDAGADEPDAQWTCLTVTDTGAGIPAELQQAIFEPFVQGVSGYTRPHGGTGLGLAISRSLARIMGGDVTVESESGAGAAFTVWLPHVPGAVTAERV